MPELLPYIPETVTVHLGAPDQSAQNATVSFPDYIKNVASSEIYPTWPESAIRANIYAQISFALNRIYTEYYRSRGYPFDITSSTSYDQAFFNGRDIFDNISRIVNEIFNSYLVRQGFVEPLFAQYCDGYRTTCDGLSQWGTVELANQGYTPYAIRTYYYGDNIDIVRTDDIRSITSSVPAVPLRLGSSGNEVLQIQRRLNRISTNFPAIPKIYPTNGLFGNSTEEAVRAFQKIFGLTQDGIVGQATWYRIQYIFNSVKKLSDLRSEGLTLPDISLQFPTILSRGMSGDEVRILQYYLRYVAQYISTLPPLNVDGIFGPATEEAVRAFQRTYGLTEDGIVGLVTWNKLYNVYLGLVSDVPYSEVENNLALPYPGIPLELGDAGDQVRALQTYLNYIARYEPSIPSLTPDGIFGEATQNAVIAFKKQFGLEDQSGVVGPTAWARIAEVYDTLYLSHLADESQYPGYVVE